MNKTHAIGELIYDATSDPSNPGWVVWTGDPDGSGAGWQPVGETCGPDAKPAADDVADVVIYHTQGAR